MPGHSNVIRSAFPLSEVAMRSRVPADWPDAQIRTRSLAKYRRRAAGCDRTCGPASRIREVTVAALRLLHGVAGRMDPDAELERAAAD